MENYNQTIASARVKETLIKQIRYLRDYMDACEKIMVVITECLISISSDAEESRVWNDLNTMFETIFTQWVQDHGKHLLENEKVPKPPIKRRRQKKAS